MSAHRLRWLGAWLAIPTRCPYCLRRAARIGQSYEQCRRDIHVQPEVGLPPGYEPPSAALYPPVKLQCFFCDGQTYNPDGICGDCKQVGRSYDVTIDGAGA